MARIRSTDSSADRIQTPKSVVYQRPRDIITCRRIGNPSAAAEFRFPEKVIKVIDNHLDNFISLTPPGREPLRVKFTDLDQVLLKQEVKQFDEALLPRATVRHFPRCPDELIDEYPIVHPFDQYVSENAAVNHGK